MNYDVYLKGKEQPVPVSAEDTDDVFNKLPNEYNPDDVTSIVPVELEQEG